MKRSKLYEKTVKNAYNLLVTFRRKLEDDGEDEAAAEVENAYKMLWTECLNEDPPWSGEPAVERGGYLRWMAFSDTWTVHGEMTPAWDMR